MFDGSQHIHTPATDLSKIYVGKQSLYDEFSPLYPGEDFEELSDSDDQSSKSSLAPQSSARSSTCSSPVATVTPTSSCSGGFLSYFDDTTGAESTNNTPEDTGTVSPVLTPATRSNYDSQGSSVSEVQSGASNTGTPFHLAEDATASCPALSADSLIEKLRKGGYFEMLKANRDKRIEFGRRMSGGSDADYRASSLGSGIQNEADARSADSALNSGASSSSLST